MRGKRRSFQLLSPWPTEAREFLVAAERAGRLIRAARLGIGDALELSFAGWRLLKFLSVTSTRSLAETGRELRVSRQAIRQLAHRLESIGCLAMSDGGSSRKAKKPILTLEGATRMADAEETLRLALHEVVNDFSQKDLAAGKVLLNRFSGRLRRFETVLRRRRRPKPRKDRT